jgi:hypothetical protein
MDRDLFVFYGDEPGNHSFAHVTLGPDGLPVAQAGQFKSRIAPQDKYVGRTPSRITPQIEQFAKELTGVADVHFVAVPTTMMMVARQDGYTSISRRGNTCDGSQS